MRHSRRDVDAGALLGVEHLIAELKFAALYSWWKNPALAEADPALWTLTTTILTRAAVGPVAEIHDRTPLILSDEFAPGQFGNDVFGHCWIP